MNEYSLIMAALTKYSLDPGTHLKTKLGTSSKELCKILGFTDKFKFERLREKLFSFVQYISPLGLQLRQNPFTQRWFLTSSKESSEFLHLNPFFDHPRLGATLYTIIALSFIHNNKISRETIKEYRKKKDISKDLEELEKMQFIICHTQDISLHPNLGYYINLQDFSNISENLASLQSSTEKSEKPKQSEEAKETSHLDII